MSFCIKHMHLLQHSADPLAQLLCNSDQRPSPRFSIEQSALRDGATKHFLKAHGLCAELKRIRVMLFRRAAFIFDRVWKPPAHFSMQLYAVWGCMEFYHIACPGYPKLSGCHRKPAQDQGIASAFPYMRIVRPLVKKGPFRRAQILPPLTLDMDQRPLAAAKCEMLQAGKLEIVRLIIDHPMRKQLTPAGKASSSTETT